MADSGTGSGVTESSLLSKLESSSDLSGIHQLYLSYLQPFSPVLKKKSNRSPKTDTTTLRSLAKKFLSFINKSLSLLPKRLNETPKIDSSYASELFETYKLCLSCLDAVSSQLACKPYSIQIQRLRLIRCYVIWERYEEARLEGVSVLGFIENLSGKRNGKRIVPELSKEIDDYDLAMLVTGVVVSLVKCVAYGRSKEEEDYRRVLSMVNEIQQWLRVIGVDECDNLHKMLVSYMGKCALFLVGELANFDVNLICKFCVETFSEYRRSSVNDQMGKFAHNIFSSLFSQLDSEVLYSEKILTLVLVLLDIISNECMVGKEKTNVNFLELVVYVAMKCRNATADFYGAVASHFKKLANYFSQVSLSTIDLILRLYAITFSVGGLHYYSRGGNPKIPKAENDISASKLLLDMEDQLQSLRISITAHTGTYMPFYFNALKFLCDPLSELIQSEHKDIVCGFADMSFPIKLPNIENVFQQFRLVFDAYCKSRKEKHVYEGNSRTVLAVAASAFTLSFTTKQHFEESTSFINELISAKWAANGLKYLYASLHNTGLVLYKANRLKEATESLKLSCQAAWKCVMHLCMMFVSNKDESSSEDAISAFVTETCAKSAFLLDILHQCGTGSEEIRMILTDFLECWYAARHWFDKIPIPVALIEQWVNIMSLRCRPYTL